MKKSGDSKIPKEFGALQGRDEFKFLEGILAEMSFMGKVGNSHRFDQISKELKSGQENLVLQGLIELNSELTMTEETVGMSKK